MKIIKDFKEINVELGGQFKKGGKEIQYYTYRIIGTNGLNDYISSVHMPLNKRPEKSSEIVEESENFVNGFKVVKISNGEYAYVRESDNLLLPYRYDVVSNFNDYGFAVVGRDGYVSWIDKNFNYFSRNGEMIIDITDDYYYHGLVGWDKLSNFSSGNIPLSRLYYIASSYFGIDKKRKEFRVFDENMREIGKEKSFVDDQPIFNEKGYAVGKNIVLFDNGVCISKDNFINFAIENCSIDDTIKMYVKK